MPANLEKIYDLIVIGAGPAGLGASIYASRYKIDHIVIGEEPGGQVVEASKIENWPGEKSIQGKDLMDKFIDQAKSLGGEIIQYSVEKVEKSEDGFSVYSGGNIYKARTVIFALGMKPRKMNIPGEDKFIGKGISYCATCDASFFRGKDVAVLGGGDAAAMAAVNLSDFADKVYLLHREEVNWNPSRQQEMEKNPKIELIVSESIKELKGENHLEGIVCDSKGEQKNLAVQGLFVEIGSVPGVAIVKGLGVEVDEQNYIKVDQTQATNVEGVWAAGDATTGSNKFRQIITAAAEGAVAAGSVYKKLKL
ncbi:MAG: FAD-dependent oxidoreductase [Candidatus Moranbacteria bacterium]|jgi:thioredoxin reductase (NADPH)|nr:FAD-dependent oxidoreductase [Candidatus Moranbacteria bacterium]MDD5651933.1 FAD-dependent oxidoreductase [Candidatus Moranbacteria bacterium]MDX9855374.1 FAD-dependent oxidoreductase [Candidatus Moranbacteria bacterium]